MDNQIHFEQTPYHHVYLKDRKTLELTGIKKIESFDSLEFLIETFIGYLNIKGSDLEIIKLDTYQGNVTSKGTVDSINYTAGDNKKKSEESFLSKLFK